MHGIRAAYAKALNRQSDRDGFSLLPKLVEKELEALLELESPSHILVVGFAYKFYHPASLRKLADKAGAALLLYDTDSCNLYSRRRESFILSRMNCLSTIRYFLFRKLRRVFSVSRAD
ncbi:hypothetical protein LDC_0288 [sediment metagenome]|uniref:Uncharacterized protein n=1 Tax=sediment metagenome TaxID=749907 RepID=D9PFK6_9ZZZZ